MSLSTEQRKLAAIMFTDMVGYSALSQRNESLALELLDQCQRLLRTQFPLFNGREVKSTGDGFLVEFPSALQATQCAVEIQRAIAARNGTHAPVQHIQVRIGIHVGDVVHREADMYGDGVNIAARIEPLAVGGGICLSDSVVTQVRNKMELGLTKLDSPELKNIQVPMDVYRVLLPWQQAPPVPASPTVSTGSKAGIRTMAIALLVVLIVGAIAWKVVYQPGRATKQEASPQTNAPPIPHTPAASSPAPDSKSIAVLPFANLSTEKENEFFADGLHDDVITRLAKIRDLTVISRTSVLAYRDTASRNLKKIAAELGVATVLEGSVRRVGSKVHINAQLINARTDTHLWADTFDGDAGDIFALQADLAQKIAAALKATLTSTERELIERRPTESQEAYELYLRARALQQEQGEKGVTADFERIIAVFEHAISKDPAFALAYAQLATVHCTLYWFGFLDPSPARKELAKAAVDAAVRLAPDAPETHLAVGAYYYRIHRDWNRALAEFRSAEPHLPNDAQLCFWLAATHRRLGRWNESLGYFERAVALNPRDLAPVGNYTSFLFEMRRFERARETTAHFLDYFPAERDLLATQARTQFAIDGDRAAFARAIEGLPPLPTDPAGLSDKYLSAIIRGDYTAADQALADHRLLRIPEFESNVINNPVTLYQAYVAFLRGDAANAGRFADQAVAYYRDGQWNERQKPWVRMRTAEAKAWAGRSDEAIQEAQAAFGDMAAQDAYDAAQLRGFLGTVYIAVGRREEAVACLRELMGPSCPALSPNAIRYDPLWSRLKDDPRFEQILKSAKAL